MPTLLIVVGGVLAAAQLVRFPRTNPPVRSDLAAPGEVGRTLRRACYDCHSNETQWPWYGAIAPLSWLLHHEVTEGRRRLNFSDWADYAADPGTAAQKLSEISRSVSTDTMAPWYYLLLHPSARLTAAERDRIAQWTDQELDRQRSAP
jgi:hypothetical protein